MLIPVLIAHYSKLKQLSAKNKKDANIDWMDMVIKRKEDSNIKPA